MVPAVKRRGGRAANLPGMTRGKYLDMRAMADRFDLAYTTVRAYHNDAKRRRREGRPLPGDLPEPDETFGRSPAWTERTADNWWATRPGQGVGGGRPAHKRKPEGDQ